MISISTDTAVRVLAVELGGAPADDGQKRIGDAAQHRYRGGVQRWATSVWCS